MSGLVAHLRQALRTQAKLADVGPRHTDLLGALEAIRHGVIIVESGCGVINLNSAAEESFAPRTASRIRSGRIAARSIHTRTKAATAPSTPPSTKTAGVRSGGSFLCERPPANGPTSFTYCHFHRDTSDETLNDATALVLVIDPEHENLPRPRTVASALRFYQHQSRNRPASYPRRRPEANLQRVVIFSHGQFAPT